MEVNNSLDISEIDHGHNLNSYWILIQLYYSKIQNWGPGLQKSVDCLQVKRNSYEISTWEANGDISFFFTRRILVLEDDIAQSPVWVALDDDVQRLTIFLSLNISFEVSFEFVVS